MPIRIQNALERAGVDQAWQVIERVAGNILDREQAKVTEPLALHIAPAMVPAEAYDAKEQLTLLTDVAYGRSSSSLRIMQTGRLRFASPSHADSYQKMVRTHLADHPFFELQGIVWFVAEHLRILADAVRVDGEARLGATRIEQLTLREVRTGRSGKVGLGGAFVEWPWRDVEVALKPPEAVRPPTRLERIISRVRQSSGGTSTIYVYSSTTLPRDNDPKFSWLTAGKEATDSEFEQLIRVLLKERIAGERTTETNDRLPVSIVTFHDAWNRLPDALAASYEGQSVEDELKEVVTQLRSKFD